MTTAAILSNHNRVGTIARNAEFRSKFSPTFNDIQRLERLAKLEARKLDPSCIQTELWHLTTESSSNPSSPLSAVHAIAPVDRAPISDRILVVGTEIDRREDVQSYLASQCKAVGLTTAISETKDAHTFWVAFFGRRDFLDIEPERLTIPRLIVTSGNIRYLGGNGVETLNVTARLSSLAGAWGIESRTFHPPSPENTRVIFDGVELPPRPRKIE